MSFDPTLAPTRSGVVRGTLLPSDDRHQRPVSRFRGIPFAAPVIGERRFAAPQRETPWDGTLDAIDAGPFCPQDQSTMGALFGAKPQSGGDDCLNLNVWTPGVDDGARPVMVWIHGGAFVTGSGATPWYDGQRFSANHDLVIVTINYRLGALGYLNIADIVPESAGVVTPNAGLLDQIAALEWVRECIPGFGGDPSNVTIFGESAGAMSIGALLGARASQGLFRRAIMQSGASAHISRPERAARAAQAFLDQMGVATTVDGITSLAAANIDDVLRASKAVAEQSTEADGLPWQPSSGTLSLPDHPLDVARRGEHRGIDILFGTTRDEMRLFTAFDPAMPSIDEQEIRRRLNRSVGAPAADAIASAYLGDDIDRSALATWNEISTDEVFRVPAHQLAAVLHEGGANSIWAYEFMWPTPVFGGGLGSCHALEIPFVFDNLHQPGVEMFTGTGSERQGIADLLHHAWASFARHGDPNVDGSPKAPQWLPWNPEERHTLAVGTEPELVVDPRGDELRRWPL